MPFALGWYAKILWYNTICQWPVGWHRTGWSRRKEQWKYWESTVLQVCTKTRYNLFFYTSCLKRIKGKKKNTFGRYKLLGRINADSDAFFIVFFLLILLTVPGLAFWLQIFARTLRQIMKIYVIPWNWDNNLSCLYVCTVEATSLVRSSFITWSCFFTCFAFLFERRHACSCSQPVPVFIDISWILMR